MMPVGVSHTYDDKLIYLKVKFCIYKLFFFLTSRLNRSLDTLLDLRLACTLACLEGNYKGKKKKKKKKKKNYFFF
jgi:hypothetical protein